MTEPVAAPAHIKEWLECLFWFTGLIGAVIFIVKQVRGEKPKPANELLGESHGKLEERVEKLEEWRDDLTDKLEADKQAILLSGSQRGQRIYEKIDKEVKSLRDDMRDISRELTKKCEDIPGEVIATLANAKKLTQS